MRCFYSYLYFLVTMMVSLSSLSTTSLVVEPSQLSKVWLELQNKESFKKRQWTKLLHYERDSLYRIRSQVSDPHFFLADEGYKKADEEMFKTLEAFFWKEEDLHILFKTEQKAIPQHPLCKFPARLVFLKAELPDHPLWQQLPKVSCPYLDFYRKSLDAQSISYVFSSYYADNPGSAFGHTFFRINKKERAGEKKQELLDYGISFAANADTSNPLIYAIFGLAGGFTGTYTNVPYYFKVREYNDFESRDLWSYDLNLTPQEVDLLILHFWELGPHYFTYYFFTQNCSYQMLTALEAAAPRLSLSEKMPLFIIPADSVKVLFQEKGFVNRVEFRPSLKRQFDQRYDLLKDEEKKIFQTAVAHRKKEKWDITKEESFSRLTTERQSQIVDSILDYADLKDPEGTTSRKGEWFSFKERSLILRSQIDHISEELKIPIPQEDRPDYSHPSTRISLGSGQEKTLNQAKQFLDIRFALHDLLDSKVGLPKFSQLEFMHFRFSYFQDRAYFDQFSFVKMLQLNPLTALEKRISWGADLGVKRGPFCSQRADCWGTGFQSQFGYSLDQGPLVFWLMPLFSYRYGEFFDKERHRYAYGVNLGGVYNFSDQHRFYYFHEKSIFNYISDSDADKSLEENYFEYRWNYLKDQSISLISDSEEAKALWHLYF